MKTCKQCAGAFEVTDRDREYYTRIKVPEPTFCPECRQQRRYAWRNERHLYHRTCGLCKKKIISMYSEDKPFPVYCPDCWWGDQWDAADHGRDFDFNRPFFDQFKELQGNVPRISLYIVTCENSDYCNFVGECRNCYLIFGPIHSEDCLYGSPYYSKNCVDTLVVRDCEKCYEITDSRKLYNSMYCQDCFDSDNLLFCYDLQGCSECIACAGLRNKKYCVENKQYSKEEYEKIKAAINFCDPQQLRALKERLKKIKLTSPHHYMPSKNVQNVSGSHIYNCKNTFHSFYVDRCEDSAYCMQVVDLKDCYDNNYTEENELCYEYLGMYGAKNAFYSTFSRHGYDTYYSEYCISSKNHFGCVGVRNKDYCILNKQYSKEEYETLVPKIIEHMKSTGEWGEFFPITHAPFDYNETVAHEYFPMEKEQVLAKGWQWKEPDQKDYQPQTVKVQEDIKEVSDDITKEVLACQICGKNYKIVPQELKFYREMILPIPKECPDCRHKDRMALRNPRKLYKRKCDQCEKSLETTYAPERDEKVYCEECYLKEIY